jgi:nucleotide-binding universal stress UspA family protein
VTIVSEQLHHQAERLIERTIDGPVLACIDEGPCGRAAARIAGSLARRLGARVLLATVAQAPPRTPAGGHLTSALVRRRRELLASAAGELDQPAETRVAFGEPAERLIALAQREGAEFIVVAGPGESCTKTVLGSVYLALAGAGPRPQRCQATCSENTARPASCSPTSPTASRPNYWS